MKKIDIRKVALFISMLLFFVVEAGCWEKEIFIPLDTNTDSTSNDTNDTIISGDTTSTYDSVINNPPNVGNNYLKVINIPKYDPNNPEHFLITPSNNGWSQINNPGYRYFYVEPGKYPKVSISQSATEDKPRYICLNNNNELHPAQLSENEQVNVLFSFQGVQNWIIDRISVLNCNVNPAVLVGPVSKNIIFNRMYFYNFRRAFEIQSNTSTTDYTKDITIQNCRIERMSDQGLDEDNEAIILNGSDIKKYRKIEDVHIINNEIVNCNDGVHTLRLAGADAHDADYPGLVIANNHIYVDERVYTDGKGKRTPTGYFALTENAVDLKAGSNNPNKPIIIVNNYFWGFRTTDTNGGGSGDAGNALVGHYDVKNVIIENNTIFNSNYGIYFGDASVFPYSCENVTVSNNIIATIGEYMTSNSGVALKFHRANNIILKKNIIVGSKNQAVWFETYQNGNKVLSIFNNVVINMKMATGLVAQTTDMKNNFFFNTPTQAKTNGTSYPSAKEAHMINMTFTTDRFTNNPRTIALNGVVLTSQSPQIGK